MHIAAGTCSKRTMRRQTCHLSVAIVVAGGLASSIASAQQNADELAKALSNPVASLVSVPFQYNYDETYDDDGSRHTLNIQPVIPISISQDWNLISRTVFPVIHQSDVIPGRSQTGLGDTVQSLFFSPKEPTAGGLIWGVGPAMLLPTGTDDLGADTWGIGPTFVVLKQTGPWTLGLLANHIADVGGSPRRDISATFVQPFIARAFSGGRTLTFNAEATYDWNSNDWTTPINITYSKVVSIGGQLINLVGGGRVYADTPAGGPDWGLRFVVVLLYPK